MAAATTTGRSSTLPDFSGRRAADAAETLMDAGLTSRIDFVDTADITEAGFVIGQTPAPGAPARRGSTVSLVVAHHPEADIDVDAAGQAGATITAQLGLYTPETSTAGTAGVAPTVSHPYGPAPASATGWEQLHPGAGQAIPTPDTYRPDPAEDAASADVEQPGAAQAVTLRPLPTVRQPPPNPAAAPRSTRRSRRRKRYQRLTLKQKALAGAVVVLLVVLIVAALTAAARPSKTTATHASTHRTSTGVRQHPSGTATATTPVRVQTVTVTAPVNTRPPASRRTKRRRPTPARHKVSHVSHAATTPTLAAAAPVSAPTAETPATHTAASAAQSSSTAVASKPAAATSSSASHSTSSASSTAASAGGSALTNPDGAATPSSPTQP